MAVARFRDIAQLDTVPPQPTPPPTQPPQPPQPPAAPLPPDLPGEPSLDWQAGTFDTREIRKARERADRAARRADRAARRVREAQERAGQRSGARLLVDAAGDAATAALTAVSAAADEAQARLAAKARIRELEQAVVTVRAGGRVQVTLPTREEALKLADELDPGSSGASLVRGLGFIVAGTVALAMMLIGGFGWLGLIVPVLILMVGGSLASQIENADRRQKAAHIQLELARASLPVTDRAASAGPGNVSLASAGERRSLLEDGDPRTSTEVLAVLDRLIANVAPSVAEADVATLQRIRAKAALALPANDEQLDLTDHDIWLLRQICIDYVPRAMDHYIALPERLSSEPILDGRSARQVLDEQLALIETRLAEMATRSYRREAGELLTHARFVADSLRGDPFQERLAELASKGAKALSVAAEPANIDEPPLITERAVGREPVNISEPSRAKEEAVVRQRERA